MTSNLLELLQIEQQLIHLLVIQRRQNLDQVVLVRDLRVLKVGKRILLLVAKIRDDLFHALSLPDTGDPVQELLLGRQLLPLLLDLDTNDPAFLMSQGSQRPVALNAALVNRQSIDNEVVAFAGF